MTLIPVIIRQCEYYGNNRTNNKLIIITKSHSLRKAVNTRQTRCDQRRKNVDLTHTVHRNSSYTLTTFIALLRHLDQFITPLRNEYK